MNTTIKELFLHVHNDIDDAAKYYKIPLAMYDQNDVYIMQQDRLVFIGKPQQANHFIHRNKGKYCKSLIF